MKELVQQGEVGVQQRLPGEQGNDAAERQERRERDRHRKGGKQDHGDGDRQQFLCAIGRRRRKKDRLLVGHVELKVGRSELRGLVARSPAVGTRRGPTLYQSIGR